MTVFEVMNRITSPYGYRTYKNNAGKTIKEFHRGVDLVPTEFSGQSVSENSWNVREVTGGTVLRVAYDNSRGSYVDVQTSKGIFERYQHLKNVYVKVGQVVPQGTIIGVAGNTGNSTGRHLHFGVYKNGKNEFNAIDPHLWLGIPNVVGKYYGNNTKDNEQEIPVLKPKMYNVTVTGVSAGDSAKVQVLAKEIGVGCTVKEV